MYNGLLHLHNLGRWVLIILLLVAVVNSMMGMTNNKPYTKGDRKIALFTMITAHIMLLVGFYQWFAGPWGYQAIQNRGFGIVMKDSVARFWAIEHMAGMLIGIILITIAKGVARKPITDPTKHKRSFWLFFLALVIILISVPWPFREVARPLFPGMSL